MPKKGMLYFFSDTSPDELGDLRVLYADSKKLVRREFPEDLVDRKDEEDFIAQVPEYAVKLFPIFTLPSVELLRRRARLTDDDETALSNLHGKLTKLANPAGRGTQTENEIALLQLNGYELSPKGITDIFDHWCSDGLIHVVIKADALEKMSFEKASASMAYTKTRMMLSGRQREPKRASVTELALGPDATAVPFDDALRDVES